MFRETYIWGMSNKTNPDHYKKHSKEVWQMMIDVYSVEKFIAFCEVNSLKYRLRAGLKGTESITEDIEKALWYENKIKELTKDWVNAVKPKSEDPIDFSKLTGKFVKCIVSDFPNCQEGKWYEVVGVNGVSLAYISGKYKCVDPISLFDYENPLDHNPDA